MGLYLALGEWAVRGVCGGSGGSVWQWWWLMSLVSAMEVTELWAHQPPPTGLPTDPLPQPQTSLQALLGARLPAAGPLAGQQAASHHRHILWQIDPSHKSHNAPVPYPTMHLFVTEMCTCAHFCYKMVHCGIYD